MNNDGKALTVSNGDDFDSQNIKYDKRKRRRNRKSTPKEQTIATFGGLTIAFCILYGYRTFFPRERLRRLPTSNYYENNHWEDFETPHKGTKHAQEVFGRERRRASEATIVSLLHRWIDELDNDIYTNRRGGFRWIRPYLLPDVEQPVKPVKRSQTQSKEFFGVPRDINIMAWKKEWDEMSKEKQSRGPAVDYTKDEKYTYLPLMDSPPARGYPQMSSLADMMRDWPQTQDYEGIFSEKLLRFNYSNPSERAAAERFRDEELPFKVYDIPSITRTSRKWKDDDYIDDNFMKKRDRYKRSVGLAHGNAQESPNHYFAFFVPEKWSIAALGLPPIRNTNMTYSEWAEHARYADAVGLKGDQPHYYWQAGVPAEERHHERERQTFITKDMPLFSTTEDNFFVFEVESQKGIQCRFGERGVTAATHYDGGRNMVAMLQGAKRYILSPPNQCSKLGIFTSKKSPIFRHSLLNFDHLNHMDEAGMSPEEKAWLEKAATSRAVETVLREGEVLYIPSHWFHYIVSLQKSAQCNVRSGVQESGRPEFGGLEDVEECR